MILSRCYYKSSKKALKIHIFMSLDSRMKKKYVSHISQGQPASCLLNVIFLGWSAPLTYPTAEPSLYCLLHDLPKSLYKNIIESLQ